jgi:hypothetical protein
MQRPIHPRAIFLFLLNRLGCCDAIQILPCNRTAGYWGVYKIVRCVVRLIAGFLVFPEEVEDGGEGLHLWGVIGIGADDFQWCVWNE